MSQSDTTAMFDQGQAEARYATALQSKPLLVAKCAGPETYICETVMLALLASLGRPCCSPEPDAG